LPAPPTTPKVSLRPAQKSPAASWPSGIAVEYIDPAVRPQDDLFTHLNGKWLATTEIPADKASWGSFASCATISSRSCAPSSKAPPRTRPADPEAQRIGDFYASFMDEAKLEQLGLTPLNAELAKIAALKDKKQLPALISHLGQIGVTAPYNYGIHQDNKDSTKYVADLYQDGLGLPDRDYYLKADDAKLADALAKYELHVEQDADPGGRRQRRRVHRQSHRRV
jgi:putative endopeptidase